MRFSCEAIDVDVVQVKEISNRRIFLRVFSPIHFPINNMAIHQTALVL